MPVPNANSFHAALGDRIRSLRGTRITQEKLAALAGLSRSSLVNIEAGRQRLLVYHLFQIAKALELTPSELLAPLEPGLAAMPEFDVEGEDAGWIHRTVQKAIRNQDTHDTP